MRDFNKSPIKKASFYYPLDFIDSHIGEYSVDEVKNYISRYFNIKITEEKIIPLVNHLNLPEIDILNEYIFRYFTLIMNNQMKNINSSADSESTIAAIFKDSQTSITILEKSCTCTLGEPIEHSAYYINNPFALDWLNQTNLDRFLSAMNPMDRNVIRAIAEAQADINKDSMTNILDSVINKKDLNEVRSVLKKAYSGDTIINNGQYYYSEDGVDFDFRNISAGLKSFALIERMLEAGVLKRKDVLILDEPEIHLHSKWQIIYAELIVVLQKVFDLTILIATHSIQFLESLNFFMEKYEISNRGNYYLPSETEKGISMESCGNNLSKLRQNLKSGMFKLADMKLEELSSGDNDEDDN